MSKKSHYIIFVAVVLLVVVLLNLPTHAVRGLKIAISGLFLPMFGLAASTHQVVARTEESLGSKKDLLEHFNALKTENQSLKIQVAQDANILLENGRLHRLLNSPPPIRCNYRAARVIAREPSIWWHSVWIDLGSQDGVRTNAAVMAPDGLAGLVRNVAKTRSQVFLLGDASMQISVKIGTNGETGVVMPSSPSTQDYNMLDLGYLSGPGAIHPGDRVVTWEAGGVIPGGIPVGQVVDSQTNGYATTVVGRVRLSVDLGALEEVWVITQ